MRIYNVEPAIAGLQSVRFYAFEVKNARISKNPDIKYP
jgi:hypothetical protein